MYPSLYHAHHNLHLEDIPFWQRLAAQQAGPVLELGCGTGRVLSHLARQGTPTFGLDLDYAMLEYLLAHLPAGMQTPPAVFQADMSAFRLTRRFALILLPCNTFSTLALDLRQKTLDRVFSHLDKGGLFVVSMPNPEVLLDLPRSGEAEVEETFFHPESGDPVQVSSAWKRSRDAFTLFWHYDVLSPDGRASRTTLHVRHNLVPASIYLAEFEQAGFVNIQRWGDFDFSAYQKDSPSLILAGQQAEEP